MLAIILKILSGLHHNFYSPFLIQQKYPTTPLVSILCQLLSGPLKYIALWLVYSPLAGCSGRVLLKSRLAVTVVCLTAGIETLSKLPVLNNHLLHPPPSPAPSSLCHQKPPLLHLLHSPSLGLAQVRHKPDRDCLTSASAEITRVLQKTQKAQLRL